MFTILRKNNKYEEKKKRNTLSLIIFLSILIAY